MAQRPEHHNTQQNVNYTTLTLGLDQRSNVPVISLCSNEVKRDAVIHLTVILRVINKQYITCTIKWVSSVWLNSTSGRQTLFLRTCHFVFDKCMKIISHVNDWILKNINDLYKYKQNDNNNTPRWIKHSIILLYVIMLIIISSVQKYLAAFKNVLVRNFHCVSLLSLNWG